jgi:adenosylmethionine-8-amino-7-oxononanoate aminotransferase
MPKSLFLEAPSMGYDSPIDLEQIARWRSVLSEHKDSLAALIVEPVVQGAGGMRIYNPQWLSLMRELCDEFDLLLIFDEIATGFGRTGQLFAFEHAKVVPDILCLGKALTGGYLTLSATITSQKVADGVCNSEAGVFMHGPTFMGNPLACAIAVGSLKLLLGSPWQRRVTWIEEQMKTGLECLRGKPGVKDVRVLGAIGVVEMSQKVDVASTQRAWVASGVWIRPFGKLVYIMPPYVISQEQLSRLVTAIILYVDSFRE